MGHITSPRLNPELYSSVIPFTSSTGTFGFNTFLYMFVNGIIPIGCSITPYPVHYGVYEGSTYAATRHDVEHAATHYGKLMKTQSIRILYLAIISDKDVIPIGMLKGFILLLFDLVHEQGTIFTCNEQHIISNNSIAGMLRTYYSAEKYGFKTDELLTVEVNDADGLSGDENVVRYVKEYKRKASIDVTKDLCRRYDRLYQDLRNEYRIKQNNRLRS